MRYLPILLLLVTLSFIGHLSVSFANTVLFHEEEMIPQDILDLETIVEAKESYVGMIVTVEGVISLQGANTFMMKDDQYSLSIDCGPWWYHSIDLHEKERVRVTGKIGFRGPPWNPSSTLELDVCQIVRENGHLLTIRPDCTFTKPPPWAGPPWLRD